MALTLRPGSPEDVGMSSLRLRGVSDLVDGWVKDDNPHSMVVLVARKGVIVMHEAVGHLAPGKAGPPTLRDTIFELASITKVLTATAIVTLVEEGRVGLNRPVSTYIPEFVGEGKEGVLVRHLLTHTSGLRNEELEKYVGENEGRARTPASSSILHPLFGERLALRYGCPLWKRPGEEMSYCDFNFDLVADIVCRVTGVPFDRFAHDRIFRPLGMKDSFYCLVDAPRNRCVGYPPWTRDAMDEARETERFWMGCGCALSTAFDMAVFGQMFLNRGAYGGARVLSPASVQAMTRNQIPGVKSTYHDQVFPEAAWGLGWCILANKTGWNGGLQSPRTYLHTGNGGAFVWIDPIAEIVGVYFSATRFFASDADVTTPNWAKHWRNDLFADAVTAAITDH